jgi:hypothetical protein
MVFVELGILCLARRVSQFVGMSNSIDAEVRECLRHDITHCTASPAGSPAPWSRPPRSVTPLVAGAAIRGRERAAVVVAAAGFPRDRAARWKSRPRARASLRSMIGHGWGLRWPLDLYAAVLALTGTRRIEVVKRTG